MRGFHFLLFWAWNVAEDFDSYCFLDILTFVTGLKAISLFRWPSLMKLLGLVMFCVLIQNIWSVLTGSSLNLKSKLPTIVCGKDKETFNESLLWCMRNAMLEMIRKLMFSIRMWPLGENIFLELDWKNLLYIARFAYLCVFVCCKKTQSCICPRRRDIPSANMQQAQNT